MGKPYSLDLRERICRYILSGNSCRSAGRVFGVSVATAVRYAAEYRKRGDVSPKPQGRAAGRYGKLTPHIAFLIKEIEGQPDITLQELTTVLKETRDVSVHFTSIHRALERVGFSYKKRVDCSRTKQGSLAARTARMD